MRWVLRIIFQLFGLLDIDYELLLTISKHLIINMIPPQCLIYRNP